MHVDVRGCTWMRVHRTTFERTGFWDTIRYPETVKTKQTSSKGYHYLLTIKRRKRDQNKHT